MLNRIVIMGRMVKTPELRKTTSGLSVVSFTVAVDREYAKEGSEKKCDFIDCVAWRSTAEFVSKYFVKGKPILVEGRLQSRDWETREGDKRRSWEIQVESCYFCGGEKTTTKKADVSAGDFEEIPGDLDDGNPFVDDDDDGELPF